MEKEAHSDWVPPGYLGSKPKDGHIPLPPPKPEPSKYQDESNGPDEVIPDITDEFYDPDMLDEYYDTYIPDGSNGPDGPNGTDKTDKSDTSDVTNKTDESDSIRCMTEYLPTKPRDNHHLLFLLAKALLKEVPKPSPELQYRVATEWYDRADKRFLRDSKDDYLFEFMEAVRNFDPKLAEFDLAAEWLAAQQATPPLCAVRFERPVQALIALCKRLQVTNGTEPFFLSCETVAGLLGYDHAKQAHRILRALCEFKILKQVTRGGRRNGRNYASSFLYIGD